MSRHDAPEDDDKQQHHRGSRRSLLRELDLTRRVGGPLPFTLYREHMEHGEHRENMENIENRYFPVSH